MDGTARRSTIAYTDYKENRGGGCEGPTVLASRVPVAAGSSAEVAGQLLGVSSLAGASSFDLLVGAFGSRVILEA